MIRFQGYYFVPSIRLKGRRFKYCISNILKVYALPISYGKNFFPSALYKEAFVIMGAVKMFTKSRPEMDFFKRNTREQLYPIIQYIIRSFHVLNIGNKAAQL